MKQIKKTIMVKNNVPEVSPAQTNVSKLFYTVVNESDKNVSDAFISLLGSMILSR